MGYLLLSLGIQLCKKVSTELPIKRHKRFEWWSSGNWSWDLVIGAKSALEQSNVDEPRRIDISQLLNK